MIIRPLAEKDLLAVSKIKIEGWQTAYKNIIADEYLNSLNINEHVKKFKQFVGNDNFLVALIDDKVVGFCRFVDNNSFSPNIADIDCELTAIYVRPDLKRQGIGTEMFNYVIDKFKIQHKKKMILWCLKDNIDSINFYKHIGGEIRESSIKEIGDKNYELAGIVYDLK